MWNRNHKEITTEEYYSQIAYFVVVIIIAALGGLTVSDGIIPAVIYIVVAFLPIYKVKTRNVFFKYGFIALAMVAWAFSSALFEGTSFDIRLNFS